MTCAIVHSRHAFLVTLDTPQPWRAATATGFTPSIEGAARKLMAAGTTLSAFRLKGLQKGVGRYLHGAHMTLFWG